MPVEAAAGVAEALASLLGALVEAAILVAQLLAELIYLVMALIARLLGRNRPVQRPAWVIRRREQEADSRKGVITLLLTLAIIGGLAVHGFAFTRITASDGIFSHPGELAVTLFRDGNGKEAVIEDGELRLLRGRWDRLEVRDPRYRPASVAIHGTRVDLRLEKIKSGREAATEAVISKATSLLLDNLAKPSDDPKP